MKEIYVHVGLPKTATTYIQKTLHNNFYCLPFRYCKTGRKDGQKVEDRHRELWASMVYALGRRGAKAVKYSNGDARKWERLTYDLIGEVEKSDCDKHLISFEGFSALPNIEGGQDLIRRWVDMLPFKVSIIEYHRNPKEYLVSNYLSEVARKRKMPKFLDWALSLPEPTLDQARIFDFYKGVVGEGNVLVRNYDNAKQRGVFNDFVSTVGFSALDMKSISFPKDGVNKSSRVSDVEILREKGGVRNDLEEMDLRLMLDSFSSRMVVYNENNELFFKERFGVEIEPIDVGWMIYKERVVNR